MLLPHNKVSGGVQDSQIMIPSFFDRFYVMPPLTNGVHYIRQMNILLPPMEMLSILPLSKSMILPSALMGYPVIYSLLTFARSQRVRR